jgi:hypothetical protein
MKIFRKESGALDDSFIVWLLSRGYLVLDAVLRI